MVSDDRCRSAAGLTVLSGVGDLAFGGGVRLGTQLVRSGRLFKSFARSSAAKGNFDTAVRAFVTGMRSEAVGKGVFAFTGGVTVAGDIELAILSDMSGFDVGVTDFIPGVATINAGRNAVRQCAAAVR